MNKHKYLKITEESPDFLLAERGESWVKFEVDGRGIAIDSFNADGIPTFGPRGRARLIQWLTRTDKRNAK